MRITQLLPSVHSGDAVGDSAFEIHHTLQAQGLDSTILGINIDADLTDQVVAFDRFADYDTPDTTHIYHFAVPSPITSRFQQARGRKVVIYHNITPPHFFESFSEELVTITATGRHEIQSLAEAADLGLADSEFNRLELERYGFRHTGVLPIVLDFSKYTRPPDPVVLSRFDDEATNILFVGRVTPNKKQENVIKAFYVYKQFVNPRARLLLVGKYRDDEKYVQMLRDLIAELGVDDVHFAGHVTLRELIAYYTAADVLLSMSEHEGFFVPALESFYFRVPVIAYNCTAVPYTLGDAGVLVNARRYEEIAELIQMVVEDSLLRQALIRRQTARLQAFQKDAIMAALLAYLGI